MMDSNRLAVSRGGLFFIFITSCLVLIGSWAQPAAAVQQAEWARWRADVDFVSNSANGSPVTAVLTVELGHDDPVTGEPVVTDSQSQYLPCAIQGQPNSVSIKNNQGNFKGDGYISCQMPNIAQIILSMSGGFMPLDYTAVRDVDVWSYAKFESDIAASGQLSQPLFYHPDFAFGLERSGANWRTKLEAGPANDQMTTYSSAYSLVGGANRAGARIDRCDNVANPANCRGYHAYNGTTDQMPVPKPKSTTWPVTLSPTTIYIGYSPVTGVIFSGTMTDLTVDPPPKIVGG